MKTSHSDKMFLAFRVARFGGTHKEIECVYKALDDVFSNDARKRDEFWKMSFRANEQHATK